ncbi:hypothetical protein ACPCAE_04175 [Streptomyces cinereoruber]|uniref:hypothetical protein n=1 Tax=Streptomyces cinereoruber TaxID=67260 RepID=UPI003C2B3943
MTARTGKKEESSALGIVFTPRRDGLRLWDTTTDCVHGDLELPEEDREIYRALWNRAAEDGSAITQG